MILNCTEFISYNKVEVSDVAECWQMTDVFHVSCTGSMLIITEYVVIRQILNSFD